MNKHDYIQKLCKALDWIPKKIRFKNTGFFLAKTKL